MANTKKFNEQDVICAAQNVFWRNGFSATSTRELQQATQLKPGSLYSSFGNKEALYQRVLEKYVDDTLTALKKQVMLSKCPLTGLRLFVISQFDQQNLIVGRQQCLLIKTISELPDYPALIDTAEAYLHKIETEFALQIESAMQPTSAQKGSAIKLAKQLQVLIIGLRQYFSATADLEFIRNEINGFFERLRSDTKH